VISWILIEHHGVFIMMIKHL
jgi:hypothetical protein